MRRFLAIILLVMLPLQFSWAAAAAYCGHESGQVTRQQIQHLGHHEHQHTGDADAATDPDAKTSGQASFDCDHCHSTCSLVSWVAPVAALPSAAKPAAVLATSARSLAQSPPERPQWHRFA